MKEENQEPKNPFILLEDDKLEVLDFILEELSDGYLIAYFEQIIKARMPIMSDAQQKAFKIAKDHLTEMLPLVDDRFNFYSKKGCVLEAHFMLSLYFDPL